MSFEFTTKRLLLKVETNEKAMEVLDFYNRNQTLFEQYEPTRPANFYTDAYQKNALVCEYNEIIKGKSLRYFIYLQSNPKHIIGSVNFTNIMHGPFSRASIGYKLDSEYHGNGYALEACHEAIDVIFKKYDIHRIEARVLPSNLPSIKLLKKLNFQFEGIEYQSVEVNGVFQDHYRFGLISTIQ